MKRQTLIACLLLVCVALLGAGCKQGGGLAGIGGKKKGVTVTVLRSPDMIGGEACGNISLVMLEVGPVSKGVRKDNKDVNIKTYLHSQAATKLDKVPYFTYREMNDKRAKKGVDEIVAAHHFLTVTCEDLRLADESDDVLLSKKVYARIVAKVSRSNGDGSMTVCGTKVFEKEVPAMAPRYDCGDFPKNHMLKKQAMDEVLDMVIRQISPKPVHTYRPLYTGKVGDIIDGGDYMLAMEMGREALKTDPKDADMLHDMGVAAECLASRETSLKKRICLLKAARSFYVRAITVGGSDEETILASAEVAETLDLLGDGVDKAREAQDKLKPVELEFGGIIE